MTTFLLLTSFLLHAISLLAIILLFTRQNRLFDLKNHQQKLMNEMEEMMSAYLLEIQEENEKFIQQVTEAKNINNEEEPKRASALEPEQPAPPKKNMQPELLLPNMQRALAAKRYQSTGQQAAPNSSKQEPTVTEPPSLDDSLLSQIVYWQAKGLTNEEIAKKLNKGKTEIELALKFNQKNE